MTDALAASPLARALGLALLQFLWQGLVIGAATAILLTALRRTTAETRYAVACLGLALMCVAPVVTAAGYLRETPVATTSRLAAAPVPPLVTPPAAMTLRSSPTSTDGGRDGIDRIRARIERWLPFVVLTWSAGVLVFALHLFRGWVRLWRIQRRAAPLGAGPWPAAVRRIAVRLGVTRPVRLVECALMDAPAVIGWLRPVILVPASALAGLAPAHLEAILAHELAHIRRGDYLINAVQCVVEVLLFYHPAVWWVSRQIRLERENCCDDLAASLSPDRVSYARALASLEELRGGVPRLAMAAGGAELLHRIRRLVDPGSAPGPRWSGGFMMSVVVTVLLIVASGQIRSMPAGDVRSNASNASIAAPAAPLTEHVAPTPAPSVERPPKHRPVAPVRTAAHTQVVATTPPRDPRPADRGRILGEVRDQQGGTIPGATATVTSPVSSGTRTTFTNVRGQFVVEDLAVGAYDVTVTLQGFKTSRTRVQVVPNEAANVNVRLQLGAVSEMVEVRGRPGAPVPIPPAGPVPTDLRTATDYFDAAKLYYEQGRLAESEMMTTKALALLRAELPENPSTPPPPVEGVIRVGGDIREPVKIRNVPPIYPAEALAAGTEGSVIIEAVIAKDGTVADATILKGMEAFNASALGAVRQWRYSPPQLNGVPVSVAMTISVSFTMR